MRFIAILTPVSVAKDADFAQYSLREERQVWKLYANGIVRHMYFQSDPVKVVLDFEADDRAAVQSELSGLPMVEVGLFSIEIIELGAWVPLAILFGPQAEEP
jgi:muconolactone delta-isomerase